MLYKLANIPIIGHLFLNWAKRRTLNRLPYLLKLGKDLRTGNSGDNKELIVAAKPYRKG